MKIRADFVTNSSSSSYVDIYADNPVLQEMIKKYDEPSMDIYSKSKYSISEHFTTDFCNEHEILEYPVNLLDYLNMVTQSKSQKFQEEVKSRQTEILGKFLYAKYNTGFNYTDGYLSGEEDHITVSSRWGVIHEQSKISDEEDEEDEDEEDVDEDDYSFSDDDPDWTYPEIKKVVRPSEATAGFEGARPEDLNNKADLNDALKYVLDHLSTENITIEAKTFGFMGLYKQYWNIVLESMETDNDENGDDEWDEDEDPWSDRESSYAIDENWSETKLIKWWMPYGSYVKAVDDVEICKMDYLVVRLDAWAEKCINIDTVKEVVERGIPVISEYQFWKAIFDQEKG